MTFSWVFSNRNISLTEIFPNQTLCLMSCTPSIHFPFFHPGCVILKGNPDYMPLYWRARSLAQNIGLFVIWLLSPFPASHSTFPLTTLPPSSADPLALVLPYYCAFSFIVLCPKCPSLYHLPANLLCFFSPLFLNLPKVWIQSKCPISFPKHITQTSNQPTPCCPSTFSFCDSNRNTRLKITCLLPSPES